MHCHVLTHYCFNVFVLGMFGMLKRSGTFLQDCAILLKGCFLDVVTIIIRRVGVPGLLHGTPINAVLEVVCHPDLHSKDMG